MKKFIKCLTITIVIWSISRFVPAWVCSLNPFDIVSRMVLFVLFLPIGWVVANTISRGQHPKCIRTNLYVFAVLEIGGLSHIIPMCLELSQTTGRYSTDVNGIPYSQYPIIIVETLCFIAIYVSFCFFFAKKTTTEIKKANPIKKRKNVPDNIPELKKFWYEGECVFAEFQSGRIMKYIDVPDKMYFAMCNAPKKSKYLFEYIVGNFKAEDVKKADHKNSPKVELNNHVMPEKHECQPEAINKDKTSYSQESISQKKLEDDKCFEYIKKYKELLDLGIITQEEFDVKKKELLGL